MPLTALIARYLAPRRANAFVLGVMALLAVTGLAKAQNVTKANNNTALSTGSSWTGGTAPGSGNIAVFNSTLTSAITANIGTGLTVKGITVTNPGGNFTISANGTKSLTLGSGGIDMSSANTGTNEFTIAATTTLSATQTFTVASGRTLTISGSLNNGGFDLQTTGAGNLVFSGAVSGAGNLSVENNGGSLTLGGNNTNLTGNVVIVNGTVNAQSNNNALGAGNVTLGNATTQSSDDLALLISSASRTFSNNLTVANAGNSTTIGGSTTSGTSTFSGNIALNGDAILTAASGGTIKFTGDISGSSNLTKTGAGTVTLNGTNDANLGNLTISAGTLSIAGGSALGANSTVSISNGAELDVTANESVGALTGAGNIVLSNARVITTGANNLDSTFSGVIQGGNGSSGLTKTGAGTLTLSNTNTYTGNTTISAGTLQLGDGTNNGAVAGKIVDGANLVFDNGSDQTYSANISGAGNLTVSGGANLTLGGNNSYSGATVVNSGTLILDDTGTGKALASTSSITINSGGTIMLATANETNTAATLTLNGGTFAINGQSLGAAGTPGIGALTLSSDSFLSLGNSSTVVFSNSSGATWANAALDVTNWTSTDQLYIGTSSAGLTSAQLNEVVFINPFGDGQNWNASIDANGRLVPAPEPATYFAGALLAALAGLAEWRRRRARTV